MKMIMSVLLDIGVKYSDVSAIILTIGALLALIGAVVIYRKWSMGDHNIEREVLMWGGGILMLIVVQAFIKIMFNM